MPTFLTIQSGFNVSSAFALDAMADRALALEVLSMSGNTIRIQFTSQSGGGSFGTLWQGANLDALVNSSTVRPTFAIVEYVPTPWGRIAMANNTTDTVSLTIYPVSRRH